MRRVLARPAGPYRAVESMPASAMKRVGERDVEFISTRALLADFDGVAEMHLPAGHRHISEFTHAAIGVELGRRIAAQAVHESLRKVQFDGK